jgi:hypothetical protein
LSTPFENEYSEGKKMRGITRAARAAVAVATMSAALTAAAAGTASAAPGLPESMGSCSAGSYYANYSVVYDKTQDGTQDRIYQVNWDIAGQPLGDRSNVEIRVKTDNGLGHDPIYWSYISGDDIRPGSRHMDLRDEDIRVPAGQRMYVEFKFVFDVPNKDDKRCDGHTRNV